MHKEWQPISGHRLGHRVRDAQENIIGHVGDGHAATSMNNLRPPGKKAD